MQKCDVCGIEKSMLFPFVGKYKRLQSGNHLICIDCFAEKLHADDLIPSKEWHEGIESLRK